MMLPVLTPGSINRIINGEDVSEAIIQILGCKKIPYIAGNDRYRLLISDGVTAYSFAMLGIPLYHLVTNKELEKFTIVSVDKYLMEEVQPERKIIILLRLTVLIPGADVGKKLGSPVNPFCASVINRIDSSNRVKKRTASEMIDSEQHGRATSVPTLTSGSINRIVNGEDVSEAIIQILGCKKIPCIVGNDRYRLLISDGVTAYSFAVLGIPLYHLVTNKELEKFTIVSVDKYLMEEIQPGRKVIILLNLTILTPGADVGKKLGSPVTFSSPFTNRSDSSSHAKKRKVGSEQTVYPTLTSGYINHALNWKDISGAVIQILGFKLIPTATVDRYQLLISDGMIVSSFSFLSTQLNSLIVQKELEKFAIIQVDKYICCEVQLSLKVIILCNITVLIPGAHVGNKLGNPVHKTSPIDDLTQPLDEIVCNFATLNI